MKKTTAEKLDSTKTEVLTAAEKTEALAEEAFVARKLYLRRRNRMKEATVPARRRPVKRRGRKPRNEKRAGKNQEAKRRSEAGGIYPVSGK